MVNKPILHVQGISKRFADVLANDCVHFDLHQGEIHALLGENGAGKTTLMNIISGLYLPDDGQIFFNGHLASIRAPRDAIRLGIDMVHQHFMLVPVFTVAENVILGRQISPGLSLDMKSVRKHIFKLSKDYGLEVDPDTKIEDLTIGLQQRVEILKALYRQAKILILDEPTAALTPQEAEDFFRVMHRLNQQGVSIVFITHKLTEVMKIANRISVMHRGRLIHTTCPAETDENELAKMMVGREVSLSVQKGTRPPGDVVLDVNHLTVRDERNIKVVRDVSFQIKAGEILGIAGVQGNGQTELAEALTGLRAVETGTIRLAGKNMPVLNPRILFDNGLAHIPEDRLKHGLVLPYSIAENQVLCSYYKRPFARLMHRNTQAILKQSKALINQFDIRAHGPLVPANTLSGGNQQKVVVSRELSRRTRLLIANQPTRGLDVGSIEYIHRKVIEMRDQGVAVLMISVELDEIMSLSDRIAVMVNGQIAATFEFNQVTKHELGLVITGASVKIDDSI